MATKKKSAVEEKKAATKVAPAPAKKPPVDQYHAVKTGETCESIAKAYGHDGEGQALFDHGHSGAPSNGELIASHDNLIRGANGEARDERGALVKVLTKDDVTPTTKLTEGQALLLPEGWVAK